MCGYNAALSALRRAGVVDTRAAELEMVTS